MSIDSILGTSLQQALFTYADKNKDGGLTTGELKSVTTAITGQANPTDKDAAALAKALDSDKSGKVNETEFLQASVAQANSQSLLDGGTMAALIGGEGSSNPYSALTGYNSGASVANLYSSLISGSLAGSYSANGALSGQLVAANLLAKNLFV